MKISSSQSATSIPSSLFQGSLSSIDRTGEVPGNQNSLDPGNDDSSTPSTQSSESDEDPGGNQQAGNDRGISRDSDSTSESAVPAGTRPSTTEAIAPDSSPAGEENQSSPSVPTVSPGSSSGPASEVSPPEETTDRSSSSSESAGESGDSGGPNDLNPAEKRQVQKLRRIDAKVRAHEQAHLAAAGPHAQGGVSYEYTEGPDGRRYAVGGSVSLDTSKADSPEKTIEKMRSVRQAALAPANPSSQDMSVANQAAQKLNEARREKRQQEQEQRSEERGEGNQISQESDNGNESSPEGTDGADGSAEPFETISPSDSRESEPSPGGEDRSNPDEPSGITVEPPSADRTDQPDSPFETIGDIGGLEPGNVTEPNEDNSSRRPDNTDRDGDFATEPAGESPASKRVQNSGEEGEEDPIANDFITGEQAERERRDRPGQLLNVVI